MAKRVAVGQSYARAPLSLRQRYPPPAALPLSSRSPHRGMPFCTLQVPFHPCVGGGVRGSRSRTGEETIPVL